MEASCSSPLTLGEPVHGTLNYALRADAAAIAAFQVRSESEQSGGAGRFFSDPRDVLVHDARPASQALRIDEHGIVLARQPSGKWGDFSDTLESVLDPRAVALRQDYYPALEALALRVVVNAGGKRPKYAIATATQVFTEDKGRGYLGAYSRQVHADVFEVLPEVDDASTAHWDPSTELLLNDDSNGNASDSSSAPAPQPLLHPYAAYVFGGHASSAARRLRRGRPVAGAPFTDGPENLLRERGISAAEARNMDIMLVNAWRPFSRPVRDNPLAVLDWSSVDAAAELYRIPKGVPMAVGEPPQRLLYSARHRWLYVRDMRPDEVLFFKQGDTRLPPVAVAAAHCSEHAQYCTHISRFAFHTSFRLPGDPGGAHGHRTRRSLATRMLLLFERGHGTPSKL